MVRVEEVCREYRSGRGRVRALSDVSFTVPEGTAAAVVGTSGSGKTTLLNCIGGLERPDKGAIRCFGEEVHRLPPRALSRYQRRQVGFIFQHGNLLSYLTVWENIALPMILNGYDTKETTRRVIGLLERIGLPDAGNALAQELSGGEMQRVAAARSLSHSPRLLLADEPTASLDSDTGRRLTRLLFDLGREQGCTLLLATHDPEVCGLADQMIRLRDGRVAAPGDRREREPALNGPPG